jgi:3-(3-hydroxy-phenyl)propionate hydroxylase/6-hydroxy-3-succinoylpyridine 3-monooxygenase
MTSGLGDAYSLIEALTAVIVEGHDDELLDRYSQVRYRNFWNYTSPVSTEAKDFVFPYRGGEAAQNDELERMRAVVADRAALYRYLLEGGGCLSPSLLAPADQPR